MPVVTDDQDMMDLAALFDAQVLSTLEILKMMFDAEHVGMKTVNGLVDYWRYMSDRPANMEKDCARLFGA